VLNVLAFDSTDQENSKQAYCARAGNNFPNHGRTPGTTSENAKTAIANERDRKKLLFVSSPAARD
jgi:hypothetical protein